ncbi:MAG: ORF6N domain-containing protein [Bryobacteraceae bacterium]
MPTSRNGSAKTTAPVVLEAVESKIHVFRNQKVMIDADIAKLYDVPTKRLNEAVRRNASRFPADFMFRLTSQEVDDLRSQFATSKSGEKRGGRRYLPFAFTEHGVAMLSSVLTSERAVQVNIAIVRTFIKMREIVASRLEIAERLDALEQKYEGHDRDLEAVFDTIREMLAVPETPKRRIGYPVA